MRRSRNLTAPPVAALLLLLGLAPVASAHSSAGLHAELASPLSSPVADGGTTDRFTVVGHVDPGALNADVWTHRGYAYLGVWSGTCPATGIKVIDYRSASRPQQVAALPNPAGTSAEDVVVRGVDTPSFHGDLAVTGIQVCDDPPGNSLFRGLLFYDVTDPAHPSELGRWRAPPFSRGCHEVDLVQRSDGAVLAGCANIFAELRNGTPDVVLVDASDPSHPTTAGEWAIGADLGVDPGDNADNLGCVPVSFAHSVRFVNGGQRLYASYWDFGAVLLDVADPAAPAYVNRADIAPPDEDGDVHSVVPSGRLLLVNPEDFSPVDCPGEDFGGWGEVHVFDVRGAPRLLSTFATPNSQTQRDDGFYSVHNTEVARGSQAFSSWYSDGIVWWDFTDPRHPVRRGQFVPPGAEDETGYFPPVPIVWGVAIDRDRDLVLASDINSGLWILRPVGAGDL